MHPGALACFCGLLCLVERKEGVFVCVFVCVCARKEKGCRGVRVYSTVAAATIRHTHRRRFLSAFTPYLASRSYARDGTCSVLLEPSPIEERDTMCPLGLRIPEYVQRPPPPIIIILIAFNYTSIQSYDTFKINNKSRDGVFKNNPLIIAL